MPLPMLLINEYKLKQKIPKSFGKSHFITLTAENNYAAKSPLVTLGWMLHIYPSPPKNCPFPFDNLHPIKYTHLSTDPTHHSIRIQSPTFPQFTHRTDQQTDKSDGTMRHVSADC